MISNRMILNINRNANLVDSLYTKLATGKDINVPSDNPIVSSRILKFRTSLADTLQYQRNARQGLSWMEVTESAFLNVQDIMDTIRELMVTGASDVPYTADDRRKISAEIQQLYEQLGLEMNATFAGRYVFSGFRTNEPPVYTEPNDNHFIITQHFTTLDIDKTKSYQKVPRVPAGTLPDDVIVHDVNVLRLPYHAGVSNINITGVPGVIVQHVSVSTNNTPPLYNPDAYNAPPGVVHFIIETGELVFNSANIPTGDFSVTYEKQGFMTGELNPKVYFECIDFSNRVTVGVEPIILPDGIQTVNTHMQVWNGTGWGPILVEGVNYTFNPTTREITMINPTALDILDSGGHLDWFDSGTGALLTCIDIIRLTNPPATPYNMDNQSFEYEVGVSTRIAINSLAMNVYTANLYSDLKEFLSAVEKVNFTTDVELRRIFTLQGLSGQALENAITEQIRFETQQAQGFLQNKFKNMLSILDRHMSQISREHTDLGSRMTRMELIDDSVGQRGRGLYAGHHEPQHRGQHIHGLIADGREDYPNFPCKFHIKRI
jgi:flagellar hook-associated protein 3 FlgL